MYRCCVIHYGIIGLQCRKVLLAALRMSRAQSHSSRAPDGVYIALWFLGTNNHPPLVKYKVSLKYHAKEIYHPLFRLSFLIFSFLVRCPTHIGELQTVELLIVLFFVSWNFFLSVASKPCDTNVVESCKVQTYSMSQFNYYTRCFVVLGSGNC